MSTTTTQRSTAIAGLCAAIGGAIFIGVQINHPPADVAHLVTTELTVRMTAKVLFCALTLVGFAGMFLRHRDRFGRLGRVGYALVSTGFVAMLVQECLIGYYLPTLAHSRPVYVQHVLNGAMAHGNSSGIGAWQVLFLAGMGYSLGGVLFGIALFRAGVLSRWASALFAYGTVSALALAALPLSFSRPFAVPTGVALIGLGVSLWRDQHRQDRHRRRPRHHPGRAGGDPVSGSPPPVPVPAPGLAPPCRPGASGRLRPRHRHRLALPKSSTNPTTPMNTAPKTYAIRVDGHLDDHWSAWLGESR